MGSTVRLIAFERDEPMVTYIQGLRCQIRTLRHRWYTREVNDPVKIEVVLARTDEAVLDALRKWADVIVLASHGGYSDDHVPWVGEALDGPENADRWLDLRHVRSAEGTGIRCQGLVIDACCSAAPPVRGTVEQALDQSTVYIGCNGKDDFRHGPVLVWALLAHLLGDHKPDICPATLQQSARTAFQASRLILPNDARALGRWEVATLAGPAAGTAGDES